MAKEKFDPNQTEAVGTSTAAPPAAELRPAASPPFYPVANDLSPTSAVPRDWIRLAVVGEWRGHAQGPERVTPEDIASMAAYFQRHFVANGVEVTVDYDHASLKPGGPKPAAGQICEMRIVDGGNVLEGRPAWNPTGRQLIVNREYRGISPVYVFGAPDRVTGETVPCRIQSVALTNLQFLTELGTIANSTAAAPDARPGPSQERKRGMDLNRFAELSKCAPADAAKRLGVAEDAAPEAVENAVVAKLAEAQTALANAQAARGAVANALDLKPEAADADLRAAILRLRIPDGNLGLVANALGMPQDATPAQVVAKAQELGQGAAGARAERLVANAVEAGKVPPAERAWWLKQAQVDLEAATTVINGLAPRVGGKQVANTAAGGGGGQVSDLTDSEKELANSLGVAESDMQQDKGAFSRDPALQAEFRSVDMYLAYSAANRAGRVKIVGAKGA